MGTFRELYPWPPGPPRSAELRLNRPLKYSTHAPSKHVAVGAASNTLQSLYSTRINHI